MKRAFICLAALFALLYPIYAKPKIEDNTFSATVINNSDFEILVDGERIAPGAQVEHKFPLHNSAMASADWDMEYTVPLTDKVFYVFDENKTLSENKKIFAIANPTGQYVEHC